MPEGEPPFEASVRTRLNTFKYKGDVVPVLYDPADHGKVVVDYEADAEATMQRLAAAPPLTTGEANAFAEDASAFAERAAEFHEQAAGFRASADMLSAIAQAKASGNLAEVERLKAELRRRLAGGTP